MNRNHKRFWMNGLALCLSVLLAAPPGALARTRKGEKFLKEGRAAELRRDFDLALELYEKALAEDPTDAGYQLASRRVRFQAGQRHVDLGTRLREEGKLEEAAEELKKAFAIDPSSIVAMTELKRTLDMIDRAKGKKPEERGVTPAQQAAIETERRLASIQPVPELKPISRGIQTLKMNNQPIRVLYETLGKLAGVNVIFDPEFQQTGRNYSIDLTNTTLEQGLEHLSVLTKTFWKPLSANTIFVTNDNATKLRDYQEMVVKTFYIRNITTPQELQEIATAIRTLTDIRRVLTYNAHNVLILRGTVDQVALAEKVVADLDKPKSEVVVDVLVMEANRSRTRDLAATIVSGNTNGIRVPVAFSPRSGLGRPGTSTSDSNGGSSASTSVLLSNVGQIGSRDFSLTMPGALLQALMTDRGTRVLQSPQVRAVDSVKSSLKIGDRFPYATGSFQPGVGAVGVSPLVSTQFNFADVGVNVDVTPKIHSADEVSLQVDIDVSNVRDQIDIGGLKQPVIGQRKLSHNVRLRQGEVSVLGGLLQDQDTRSISGVPGLGNLPVLSRIFAGESIDRAQSELLIVLVPHIVRSLNVDDQNLRGVAAGTEQVVKLTYGPREEAKDEKAPASAGTGPAPLAPAPAGMMERLLRPAPAVQPGASPAPASPFPAPAAPVPLPAGQPPPPAPEAAKPPAPGAAAGPVLRLVTPEAKAALSGNVTVTLAVENVTDLFGAPLRIGYDPKILRLNEVVRGGLLAGDGQQPIFSRNIRNDAGEATVVLNRLPGSPGVSGSGTLVTLMFQAVGKGETEVRLTEVTLRDSQMQPMTVSAPTVAVTVE